MILLLTIDKYISTVKENLVQHSAQLTEQISKTLQFNYDPEIDLLDYTVFIQPHEFSIMMFSMDRDANEVFGDETDSDVFAGSYEVIEDLPYFEVADEDAFWSFYEPNDEEISKLETEVIVEWFKACWDEAGGEKVRLPAYFTFHDVDPCYDLVNQKWISDGDKWFE